MNIASVTRSAIVAALMLGVGANAAFARGENDSRDNGQQSGSYKQDKQKKPKNAVAVPEPGVTLLLLTGVVVAFVAGRRKRS
jgi:PEP-CTERM motif